MRPLIVCLACASLFAAAAEPEFPLTEDSKPQSGVLKGAMLKGTYTASKDSVFPGTVRDYQIYLPAGLDKTKSSSFMVFQDGVIYQAPFVFDNLIARKEIPPLIGIFIKPGVVPAVSDKALPRFNRSYEYDSVTDTYAQFLIEEFLPAIEREHGIELSTDPNQAAIAGNSSGGICAFMVAWHRHDRFRRVFTGVGTYVGIRGADRLPVLVRKIEPKPIRIFLQSGTNDNDLYCGDWWMANQMMERSLTWAGYDVNHAWGEGGHNQKHASQIFPDALRWLWRDWVTDKVVKANPKGESKWKGYEMVSETGWSEVAAGMTSASSLTSNKEGDVFAIDRQAGIVWKLAPESAPAKLISFGTGDDHGLPISEVVATKSGALVGTGSSNRDGMSTLTQDGKFAPFYASGGLQGWALCLSYDGWFYMSRGISKSLASFPAVEIEADIREPLQVSLTSDAFDIALTPDQTQLYATSGDTSPVTLFQIDNDHRPTHEQPFVLLDADYSGQTNAGGLCVDTEGRLYVATSLGIQVCDQAGRVNFVIPTPKRPFDVCFGGKDLSELFIACGDTMYKRPTKVRGVVSGQQPPIKPAPPKL